MYPYHNKYRITIKSIIKYFSTSIIIKPTSTLNILCFIFVFFLFPLNITTEAKELEAPSPSLVAYHELNNDKLLQQVQSLFDDIHITFLAKMRGLNNVELLLEEAREKSDNFLIPVTPAAASKKNMSSSESIKMEAQRVKNRLEAYQRQLKLIQTEQALLEKNIELVKQTLIEAESFEDIIKNLKIPLHELSLRVQDGTLVLNKIPEMFRDFKLEALREQLKNEKKMLQDALETAKTEFKVNTTRINEAKKVVVEFSALHASAKGRYAQELKRQELMKAYVGQEPEALLVKLAQLQDEMVGLNGSLQISQRRFSRAEARVAQIQAQLDTLKAPVNQLPQPGVALGSEEANQVTQHADAIVAYHAKRIENLKELEQGLDNLIQMGEALHGDAVVFNEHIFRMRLPAELVNNLVRDGSLVADQVPAAFHLESLAAAQAPYANYATASASAVAQAKDRHSQITTEIQQSQTASHEVREQLEHLQKIIALAEQARKWEQELKDLTAEQVATRFKEAVQQGLAAEQTLNTARGAYEHAQAKATEEREKFDSLTDPLLRLAQQEFVTEKSNITRKLYGYAGLELPSELKDQTDEATPSSVVQDGGASTQETEQYQNLLSTHSRILQEREKQRDNLKGATAAFDRQIQAYIKALNETNQHVQQQYANAVELKKRIGRQQLQGNAIPDGITEALNRARVDKLEADIAALASQHVNVKQKIDALSEPDKHLQKLRLSLDETITAVGKRLDLLKDLEVLQRDYRRSRQDFSEVERTSLAQAASHRAEATGSREEAALEFVPSAAADAVTDTLKVYYQELIELETKQDNLQSQTQVTERIIELAETEKASIDRLLPMLQEQVKREKRAEQASWVRIQAQLMPQKASELLNEYEAKVGEHIAPPPPILEGKRVAAIAQSTELLFERHTDVVATSKWLALFETRLSISGLDGEIGKYQDQVGVLNAQNAANQRRIHRMGGYPIEALATLAPEERPKTQADRHRLLQGEIGMLRQDRSDLRRHAVIDILIRVASIAVVALILSAILSLVINRIGKRAHASGTNGSAQTLLVLSFFKAILRFVIWVIAAVLIMSTLGFNIGAVLAGLGIGGLAVAMAARETLADMIGGVMIFMERPFVIGDTIQVGSGPVAKVVGMSWRTTRLLATSTYYFSMPNSQVANSAIQNFSVDKPICDWVTFYTAAEHDPAKVIAIANQAMRACDSIIQDEGLIDTWFAGVSELGNRTAMIYWPWWYIHDYHHRGGTREQVWRSLWKHMQEAGIELEIKPFELQEDEHPALGIPAMTNAESHH